MCVYFIGVDAWIDAAGYLRQKDYIADDKGYRILKSKTVYVGQGRPIVCYFVSDENFSINFVIFIFFRTP